MANMLDPGSVGPPPQAPPAPPVSLAPILSQWLGPGPDAAARNAAAVAPAPVARPVNDVAPPAYIPPRATGPIALPPPTTPLPPMATRPVNDVAPIDTRGLPAPQTPDAAFRNLQSQFADVHMAPPTLDLTSGGRGFSAAQAALGDNPFGKVAGDAVKGALGGLNVGQSALDLISVHADKLIPGPGQGTLYDRFLKYTHDGLSPMEAANATMRDYGDALQQLAEDPSAPGIARAGAQGARVVGALQSVTAPAPVPGGASLPIGIGFLKVFSKNEGRQLIEKLAAQGVPLDAEQIAARIGATTPAQRTFADQLAREVDQRAAGVASPALPGPAVTKTARNAAEQRIIELQGQPGPPLETLPPVTQGAGGNAPIAGFQIEKFPESVQPLMRELAARNADLLAQKTAPLTHEELQQAAQMIGEPLSKVADRLAKRGINSAELQMVRQGVAMKVAQASDLAAKAARGEASPAEQLNALSALHEAATLQSSLHEASSEAGRVLNVLKTQIAPELAANPSQLAYMAAISRIAKSPEHAQAIFDGLMKIGNDPTKIYELLRGLDKANWQDQVLSVLNLPRALKASFDLSAAGRQGLLLSAAHPQDALKAFKAQIGAFQSEEFANAIDRQIRTSPMAPIRQKAGVYIADLGPAAQLSQREEAFLTGLMGRPIKIKGVDVNVMAKSERAYVTYLNKLRADRFDNTILAWQRAGVDVTDDRAKLLAQWVNVASGRGTFGKANAVAPALNALLFSPRYLMSRIEAPLFPAYALMKHDPVMAKAAAADLVKYVGENTALLAMSKVAGAQVETDPRSPDFGKIRDGNVVIDTWSGFQQIARNVAQFITEHEKTVSGKNAGQVIYVARGQTAGRFVESKLSPLAGLAWDVGKAKTPAEVAGTPGQAPWDRVLGKDFLNQPFTPKELVTPNSSQSLYMPMSWNDILSAVQADREAGGSGIKGLAEGAGSFFGVGVNTYDPTTSTTKSGSGWWK